MSVPGFAWDSCCLLNLLATGRAEEILGTIPCQSHVVAGIGKREIFCVRPFLPDDDDKLVTVDIDSLLKSGQLIEQNLSTSEIVNYIKFASRLDDGEAGTLALALSRGYSFVSDDRLGLRLANENGVPTVTTPEWMKIWSESTNCNQIEVAEALAQIEICAKYVPRKNHPYIEWWNSTVSLYEYG